MAEGIEFLLRVELRTVSSFKSSMLKSIGCLAILATTLTAFEIRWALGDNIPEYFIFIPDQDFFP